MELDYVSSAASDEISAITVDSTTVSSQTKELSSYGLHLYTDSPIIILDPEDNFVACSKPIPPDDLAPKNLHSYIARCSHTKHYCCLCNTEIGAGMHIFVEVLLFKTIF